VDPGDRVRAIRIGEPVRGRDGRHIGAVDRLVVDESAHRVTHLVVDGHLVGVRRLKGSTRDELVTDLDRAELKRLPDVEGEHVSPAGERWEPPPGFAREQFLAIASALIGQAPYQPPVEIDPDLDDVHEITTGSPVWAGSEPIGEVDRVETDDSGRIVELVVRQRGLRGRRKRLPAGRITEVVGNNVHVALEPGEPESLPDYQDAD
jgi:hypothetical protein